MQLFLIIFSSVILGLSIVTFLLFLFTKKMLKNDTHKISQTMLVLLVIQFILGMINNLWVTIPKVKSYEIYHSVGSVSIHTANALLLLIFSVFFLVRAYKRKAQRILGSIGILSIVIATIGGVGFVNSGGQNDINSFIMALGFIAAFLIYAYIAFTGRSFLKKETRNE